MGGPKANAGTYYLTGVILCLIKTTISQNRTPIKMARRKRKFLKQRRKRFRQRGKGFTTNCLGFATNCWKPRHRQIGKGAEYIYQLWGL